MNVLKKLNARVEGFWDSRAAIALLTWAHEAEAEVASVLDDEEEAWAILRCRYARFSPKGRAVIVGGLRYKDGLWTLREEAITW